MHKTSRDINTLIYYKFLVNNFFYMPPSFLNAGIYIFKIQSLLTSIIIILKA